MSISSQYETDGSITRDLRVSQAYALLINVGLLSGNGRKMEIAESSAQNLVAVSDLEQSLFVLSSITYSDGQTLRRAFRYRRSKYSSIVQTTLDVGPELDNKWHHWVEQQSFKRYELGYIMEINLSLFQRAHQTRLSYFSPRLPSGHNTKPQPPNPICRLAAAPTWSLSTSGGEISNRMESNIPLFMID
jgi:hypothetical protein